MQLITWTFLFFFLFYFYFYCAPFSSVFFAPLKTVILFQSLEHPEWGPVNSKVVRVAKDILVKEAAAEEEAAAAKVAQIEEEVAKVIHF